MVTPKVGPKKKEDTVAWLSRHKGAVRNSENMQEGTREAQRKAGWWGLGPWSLGCQLVGEVSSVESVGACCTRL